MGEFVHDPRHRYSYELRPDAELDATLRELAGRLEDDGLLPAGATSAPRFQPHLTFLRASVARPELVDAIAERIARDPTVSLDFAGAFGDGRIVWASPGDGIALHVARQRLVEELGQARVDPQALARAPWTPHVTLAYAVDPPHHAAVLERLRATLPIVGRWASVQCWDLDVRPTQLVHGAVLAAGVRPPAAG